MSIDEHPPFAWQPLTPRGAAAFARARFGRLFLVQFIFAVLAAGAIAWTLYAGWFRIIAAAIDKLPPQGQIRGGALMWEGDSPQTLAENRFLAITIDLKHEGQARSPAHVQIEFGRAYVKVFSLFGFVEAPYPRDYVIAFNRPELVPWWGAWKPPLLALIVGGVILALFVIWAILASIYCWVAWLFGFFANRQLSLSQSWRLSGAALMPGALLMSATIVLYGLGALDPIVLLVITALHFILGWVYVCVSPLFLPRHPDAPSPPRVNPFDKLKSGEKKTESTP
jgi:hypothetical protein